MVFSSPTFLFFFLPITLAVYFLVRGEWRNWWLLAVSLLFFVCGDGGYAVVLVGLIGLNYLCGLWIGPLEHPQSRRTALSVSVGLNLVLLATFKYANFFADNLNVLLEWFGAGSIHLDPVHLPLGISFITFQAMSYVIDVYRRETPVQRSAARFAMYVSFFPQSIAGPIVRYSDIAAQLATRRVTRERFASGVQRFVVGMAKKVLIANTVALPADLIFRLPDSELSTQHAWLGLVCYTLQIYFDFSGYSDMAIGLGRMFGFEFLENFNYPYAARSVTEFWRRWHISLSTWFRDYVYIPLGGNRGSPLRTYFNLLTIFLLCGLWHGASWMFVLWGLYHGAFLVVERLGFGRWIETTLWTPLRHVYTLATVMLGWALFRVESPSKAAAFFMALCGQGHGSGLEWQNADWWLNRQLALALIAGVAGAFPLVPAIATAWSHRLDWLEKHKSGRSVQAISAAIPVGLLAVLLFGSAMQLAAGTYNPFIYFRF